MQRPTHFLGTRSSGLLLLLAACLTLNCMHNRPDPPTAPVGPKSIEADSAYTYGTTASNGKQHGLMYVRFDWGDGDTSPWSGHGETFEMSHSWRDGGVYAVRAQAHDDRADFSEWSAPCSVTAVVPPYPYRLIDSIQIIDAPLIDAEVSPDGEFVYVTNDWSGALSVVRTSNLQLVAQIPFNDGWSSDGQVVCSPDGRYVYATRYHYGLLAVLRTSENVVVDSLAVGEETFEAIAPDGGHLYLTGYGESAHVVVVRLPDNVPEDTIRPPDPYEYISTLLVSPDGANLFAGGSESDRLYSIRLSDESVEWEAEAHITPWMGGIAVHPAGSPLYVAERSGISVRNAGTGAVTDSVPLWPNMLGVTLSRDGSILYVAGERNDTGYVAIVRTSDNKLARVVTLPQRTCGAAPSPDGQRLYVAGDRGKLYVFGR